MNERRQIGPGHAYAPAVLAPPGRLLAVSGTVALDPDGEVVGEGSMADQARFVFDRIAALLHEGGASLADVVKITTFITDMGAYREFAAVRSEVFAGLPRVASSTVGVAALVDPRLLIEIEALAILPEES